MTNIAAIICVRILKGMGECNSYIGLKAKIIESMLSIEKDYSLSNR